MKIVYLICLMLLASTEMVTAQTTNATSTTAPPPAPRARRNMDQPDPNAPASKYDYRDAFAPFFYTKTGMNTAQPLVSLDLSTGKTAPIIS